MTLSITYRDLTYHGTFPGSRRGHWVEAELGEVFGQGRNRTEARAALEAEIERLASHPWPTIVPCADGTLLLVGVGRYDIFPVGGKRASSVMTGDTYSETYAAARSHAEQSYGGLMRDTWEAMV